MAEIEHNWKPIYKFGGVAAWIFVVYSLVTMIIVFGIGGRPETALEAFELLQENKLVGLLRLDALTLIIVPFYYPIYLSIAAGLRKKQFGLVSLGALLAFTGLTLFLATPSAFSVVPLSEKYAAATTPALKEQFLAAGEALLAADMFNNSGAMVGGILMLIATLILSTLMLKSDRFGKATAYVGFATHGLDLLHIPMGFIVPQAGLVLMMIAGPLYLVWFPLLARDLFRLAKRNSITLQT
jgi:hypothetical protein